MLGQEAPKVDPYDRPCHCDLANSIRTDFVQVSLLSSNLGRVEHDVNPVVGLVESARREQAGGAVRIDSVGCRGGQWATRYGRGEVVAGTGVVADISVIGRRIGRTH